MYANTKYLGTIKKNSARTDLVQVVRHKFAIHEWYIGAS